MHKIVTVKPMDNSVLLVGFQNGVEKTYDMHNLYSIFPQFKVFETDVNLFNQVQVDTGGYGISWNDDLDLDAEGLWEDGVETGNKKDVGIADALAVNLLKARGCVGMTQKQLSERTGIYQADISKIERGLANPSLSTLKRLAEGMDTVLRLQFIPKKNK